jgi:hypothetical protein
LKGGALKLSHRLSVPFIGISGVYPNYDTVSWTEEGRVRVSEQGQESREGKSG